MKRIVVSLVLYASLATIGWAQIQKTLMDSGWKFAEQDVTGAQATTFDDSKWLDVNLPHDWDIYHSPNAVAPTGNGGGYYPGGIGWYRKQVKDSDLSIGPGQSLWLHFEGAYEHSTIYVNGQQVATHAYGYTPFKVNITPYVTDARLSHNNKSTSKNKAGGITIAVRVDNSHQPNCRWYSGSGLYRHVWLEKYDVSKMDDPEKLFVRTEHIYGMSADGTRADSASIRVTYDDRLDETRMLRNVELWSTTNPMLYDIKVGDITVRHGVRSFSYDAKQGFLLNGQPTLINGACVHHDDGILGAMAFDAAEIRKVRLMKEAGFNLIRTSHNPQTRAMLDACDSLGMMVVDESFDGWYTEKSTHDYHTVIDSCYTEDLTAMVRRDRNHPCIICYSIGNEIIERKEIRVVHTAQKFKNVITQLDNTRPITEALCAWDNDWEIYDPHAAVLDIVGYNYMMHKAESDHERCPERVMWQTESYPRDAFSNWKHTVERPYIIGDMVWTGLDYLGESGIGLYHYDGEPRNEHWQAVHFPYHGAYCGDVDLIGWRKPISYYRDMLWNVADKAPYNLITSPLSSKGCLQSKEGKKTKDLKSTKTDNLKTFLYLAVREPDYYQKGHVTETLWSVWPTWESWNWKSWEGKDIQVEMYTKAPKVRLYLNDQLVAEKDVNIDTQYKANITLPYQPGTLKAVALDNNGKVLAESILRTSGEAYAIRLTPDRKNIRADGQDLAFVKLEVVDRDGQLVPDASIPVNVSVTGKATLLAAATADLRDLEPKTSPCVTTFKGQALIVVRSGNKTGKATVSVNSDVLKQGATQTIILK